MGEAMPAPRVTALVALVAAALLAPGATAAASFSLSSPDPVRLAGDLEVDAPGGTLHVEDARAHGRLTLHGATGLASVWTYRAANLGVRPEKPPVEEARERTFLLDNATLVLDLRREPFYMTAATLGDGLVRVSGPTRVEGLPVLLDNPVVREGLPAPLPLRMPPTVPWRWDAGWLYLGMPFEAQDAGFPRWAEPTLAMEGRVLLAAQGGNVTIPTGQGHVTFRLGSWREASTPLAAGPGVDVVQRLVFEGTVTDATMPGQAYWGVAAPDMTWRLSGDAAWTRATGTARTGQGAVSFDAQDVLAAGDFTLAPRQPPRVPSTLDPVRYQGEGDLDALTVGSRQLVHDDERANLAPAAAAVSALALAAALAFALYTRFTRDEMLDHPSRRRLHDLVAAEPGIHLRELQRRLGSAWGPFTFHLHMLTQAGYVKCVKHGGYTHVYPQDAPRGAPPIAHPLARRIHDALPADGAPVPLRDLRERVGVSRQLLAYHLRGLAGRRLVVLTDADGERRAARAAPSDPAFSPGATSNGAA